MMGRLNRIGRTRIGRATRLGGFSLIELLIVVAIVGILGAIAFPSYQNYIRESRRSDGFNALLTIANEQEKWFLANNTYAGTLASVWNAPGGRSLEDFYQMVLPSGNATTFVVRATAIAGTSQASDTCQCLQLDAQNRRRSFATTACTGADVGCW